MVVKKRSKGSRKLGTNTYGWGRNMHRGSGNRGGYGNAGTGKKSHNKKTKYWKETYFGTRGFVSRYDKRNAINLSNIQERLPQWISEKEVAVENGAAIIDLAKLGYQKLLSAGKLSSKVKIIVQEASVKATEKVKQAGSELVISE